MTGASPSGPVVNLTSRVAFADVREHNHSTGKSDEMKTIEEVMVWTEENRPRPECGSSYSTVQMIERFRELQYEWDVFVSLGMGIAWSECKGTSCGGVAHGGVCPERDVLQFFEWLKHEWPRIRRRRELHRAAAPFLHSNWVNSEALIRKNLELKRSRPSAVANGAYLDEWESAVDAGPDEVERLAMMPGRHGEALRLVTPLAGVLPEEERLRIVWSSK
mgnify:FL=1